MGINQRACAWKVLNGGQLRSLARPVLLLREAGAFPGCHRAFPAPGVKQQGKRQDGPALRGRESEAVEGERASECGCAQG